MISWSELKERVKRAEDKVARAFASVEPHKKVVATIWVLAVVAFLAYTFTKLDASLKCLVDCGPSPEGGWAYAEPLPLPGSIPSVDDEFPNMMSFHSLSGDDGPLGRWLLPVIHILPLVPPALFLTAAVTCFSWSRRPSKERNVFLWILRLTWFIMPSFFYFLIGWAGSRLATAKGIPLLLIVGMLSVLAATAQWLLFSAGRHNYPSNSIERHTNRHRALIWLTLSVLVGGLLNGTAALLIRDTRHLKTTLEKKPPRLFDPIVPRIGPAKGNSRLPKLTTAEREQLVTILDILSKPDVIGAIDLYRTRKAMESLTRSDSHEHNLVSQNLCRSGWYISICCVSLLISVILLGKRCGKLRLFFVLTAYLAIGTVFGLIYYDYFLLDAGRYHLLLNTLFVRNAQDLKAAADSCGDECSDLSIKVAYFQSRAASHQKLLGLMSSGYFASSVFAQDTPQVQIESDPPEAVSPVFACNYQFGRKETSIQSGRVLYHAHPDGIRLESECARFVASALGYSETDLLSPQTNRSSSVRLANFLCTEAAGPTRKTERDYMVRILGAADCTGTTGENDQFSVDRAVQAYVTAQKVLSQVVVFDGQGRDGAPRSSPPVNIARLQQAFKDAKLQPLVQRKREESAPCDPAEYSEILWQTTGTDPPQQGAEKFSPTRTARVEVLRRSADVTDRVHMASGLTRNTTLSDMVYFSFVSFTTTGYGDIKAVSGPVRFCVIMENILEILFAAIFFTAAMALVRQGVKEC